MFRKDFSIFAPKKGRGIVATAPSATAPAPAPPPPPSSSRPARRTPSTQRSHHSTLLLLEKHGLAQVPAGHWDNKSVVETPPSRNSKSRTVFDPDSPARQGENRLRRVIKDRKAEKEARSHQPGWLEGPALGLAKVLEDIEDVRCELRDAARWENSYLDVRERRKTHDRASWFGGRESEEERRCKLEADASVKGVSALEWTREFEPQPVPHIVQVKSAADSSSMRSRRRSSVASSFSTTPSINEDQHRLSTVSMTTGSTTRSSMMSMTQASTVSSPFSSGLPSPTTNSSVAWRTWPEKPASLSLPSPVETLKGHATEVS